MSGEPEAPGEGGTATATGAEPGRSIARWPFAALAYVCVGLGLLGVVIPGLPTVPFLLLAAWAASRGSKRLHDWLYDHPRFGPALTEWRDQRAVSTGSKVVALTLLAVSWVVMFRRGVDGRVLLAVTILFCGVALFLLTRARPIR